MDFSYQGFVFPKEPKTPLKPPNRAKEGSVLYRQTRQGGSMELREAHEEKGRTIRGLWRLQIPLHQAEEVQLPWQDRSKITQVTAWYP